MSKECKEFDLEGRIVDFAENNQLISIFITSIGTAKRKKKKTS